MVTDDPMAIDISLTFTLTKEHLVGAWRQYFRTRALISRPMVFSMTILGICFGSIVLLAWCCVPTMPVGMLSIIFAVVPGLMVFNYFVVAPVSARRSKLCGKTFAVRIREDGVSWRGGEVSAECYWSRFHEIVEGKVYFLLYLGEFNYFPLPKSAFASQADLEAFREFIANRQSGTKQAQPIVDDAGEIMRDAKAADDESILQFRLTEAERVSVLRGKLARMMASSRPILALYAVFGILAVSAVFMMLTEGFRVLYLVLLTPALAVASSLASLLLFKAKRFARKLPWLARNQLVVVNEEGLVIDNGLSTTHIAWSYISGFRKSGDLLVLDMGTDEYMPLPKRGFASPDDEAWFRDMLKRHIPGG
jgi:hypothetical protein